VFLAQNLCQRQRENAERQLNSTGNITKDRTSSCTRYKVQIFLDSTTGVLGQVIATASYVVSRNNEQYLEIMQELVTFPRIMYIALELEKMIK